MRRTERLIGNGQSHTHKYYVATDGVKIIIKNFFVYERIRYESISRRPSRTVYCRVSYWYILLQSYYTMLYRKSSSKGIWLLWRLSKVPSLGPRRRQLPHRPRPPEVVIFRCHLPGGLSVPSPLCSRSHSSASRQDPEVAAILSYRST